MFLYILETFRISQKGYQTYEKCIKFPETSKVHERLRAFQKNQGSTGIIEKPF